ncbi:MAG: serine O-acetyltransferase [Clostridia bacterium]|nr:serine O-acetyltransferase [Clostridia bacterium]
MFFKNLREDIKFAKENDPAARNKFEVWLTYPGIHALSRHRVARFFYKIHLKLIARMISEFARFLTGIDIHPGADIAGGVFIDHGSGVVIGETAVIEKHVLIYQCVTLGGTGKDSGSRRHPTVKEGCVISSGAKILGGITVGEFSKIGAGSVVIKDVPPHSTVVGVPGKVVRIKGEKPIDNTPDKCDPVLEEICNLRARIDNLEKELSSIKNEKGV